MRRIKLNDGWDFRLDEAQGAQARRVTLPHDYIIDLPRGAEAAGGGSNGYFGDGRGEYLRALEIEPEWLAGRVLLAIDGAYMLCEVFLNGEPLCMHPYGYTPFQVDLTPALRAGKNELRVFTQSPQPSTRWYSGGGLYREVELWLVPQGGLTPWDVQLVTRVRAGEATVRALVEGEASVTLLDAEGKVAAQGGKELTLKAPRLWSVDSPYLYTARVARGGGAVELPLGVREIEIDARAGFRLNGQAMKLRGGCIHHDNGCLGAAAHPDAEARKVALLKKSGYNAIRTSHYPPSQALLDACDRQGMLVMTEAFDAWTEGKKPLDYHLFFRDWWARDIDAMVRSARNHPCVFAYSVGNEIPERDGHGQGARWARELAARVRALDGSRAVTAALNNIQVEGKSLFDALYEPGDNPIEAQDFSRDVFAERTRAFCEPLDLVGYNYLYTRYAHDRALFPERALVGTESFAINTYDYWRATLENPNVIGDFIWTAVDYLGEAGIGRVFWADRPEDFFSGRYPWAHSYTADIDLIGNRRPQSYYRQILWGLASGPVLMTLPPDRHGVRAGGMGWHFPELRPAWDYADQWRDRSVDVYAYADADRVEFLLDGEAVAQARVEKLTAHAVIPYRPGKLEAVAYRGCARVGGCALETPGEAAGLRLAVERGERLCFLRIALTDAQGRAVRGDDRLLTARVEGGAIVGFGNANPLETQVYGGDTRRTWQGDALLIVRPERPDCRARITCCELRAEAALAVD